MSEHSDTGELPQIEDLIVAYGILPTDGNKRRIMALITQERKQAETIGKIQASVDLRGRLKNEFVLRQLSTDDLHDGFRKLSDEELITIVICRYYMPLLSALQQTEGETE